MQLPRRDLRKPNELRSFDIEFDVSEEAQGSCKLSQGKTCVVVSVYGPQQPKFSRHEEFDRATLEVDFRCGGSASLEDRSQIEKKNSKLIHAVFCTALKLNKFPRKLVIIRVCVIRDDGALSSVCMNACSLAIAVSGIPMTYIPVRCVFWQSCVR
jgi:exosome complex component RRP41